MSRERLFIVPGNHDLDWGTFKYLPAGLTQPLTTNEQVQEWLMDQEGIANLLRPFNAYSQFIANYDPAQTAWSYLRIFEANGLCIALLGVNSALVSGRHKETRNGKEVDIDDRYLIIGEPQIHTLLHRPDFLQADIRLAVMHHPFDWLIEFDRELVQDELKKTCDFILHGHEHRPKVTVETGTGGHCVIIPAGPSYDRREPEISRCANAYNYVHLDFELANKPGIVYLRRYEDRQGWIKDTSTTGDDTPGYFTLELPQSLGVPARQPLPSPPSFLHPLRKEGRVTASTSLTPSKT